MPDASKRPSSTGATPEPDSAPGETPSPAAAAPDSPDQSAAPSNGVASSETTPDQIAQPPLSGTSEPGPAENDKSSASAAAPETIADRNETPSSDDAASDQSSDKPRELSPGEATSESNKKARLDDDSKTADESQNDYEIGYGRPPKVTKFKKGRSGNPKGRKKVEEISDIRLVMEDVLAEQIKVPVGGKVRTISREEAMLNAELQKALGGDNKAIESLFKRAKKCGLFSKAKPQSLITITEPDGKDGRIIRMFNAEQEAIQSSLVDLRSAASTIVRAKKSQKEGP